MVIPIRMKESKLTIQGEQADRGSEVLKKVLISETFYDKKLSRVFEL